MLAFFLTPILQFTCELCLLSASIIIIMCRTHALRKHIIHVVSEKCFPIIIIIGGASAVSAATVRSSKSRFAIDICLVLVNHTGHARKRSSPWR